MGSNAGSMLVTPTLDGSRPGYYGPDAGFGDDDYKDQAASSSIDQGQAPGGSDEDFQRARDAIESRTTGAPPKKPKAPPVKTKDRFVPPIVKAVNYVGGMIKDSRLGRYLNAKARGEEPPKCMKTYRVEEIASLMPHKEPFMFLESASISGNTATARYKISGNEYFLEGHFKDNPVFPASIMIEALGQLCVFFLIKGENEALEQKVDPNTIYFTSCDGVKCRRICKPGDILEMQVKVNRIRHPLASFQGEITVDGQKTSTAEEVKLAFDYYPVIDGEVSITANISEPSSGNGNGSHPERSKVLSSEKAGPRFVKFSSDS